MAYKKLNLANVFLEYGLGKESMLLPLKPADRQAYAAAIGAGNHTWVTLSHNGNKEEIKLGPVDYMGQITILKRGSPALDFPAGACVSYAYNQSAIDELLGTSFDFLDDCGNPIDCPCTDFPCLTQGQPVNFVLPYGRATAVTFAFAVPGLAITSTMDFVTISGTPTTPGIYSMYLRIERNGQVKTINCQIEIEGSNCPDCPDCPDPVECPDCPDCPDPAQAVLSINVDHTFIVISPSPVRVGNTGTVRVTVTNSGTAAYTGPDPVISNPSGFTITSQSTSGSLAAGQSKEWLFNATANAVGTWTTAATIAGKSGSYSTTVAA